MRVLTYRNTGHSPNNEHNRFYTKLPCVEKASKGALADILILHKNEKSKNKIEQHQEAGKILIHAYEVEEFFRENFPEYLL